LKLLKKLSLLLPLRLLLLLLLRLQTLLRLLSNPYFGFQKRLFLLGRAFFLPRKRIRNTPPVQYINESTRTFSLKELCRSYASARTIIKRMVMPF
jgi:hypothetical protein